MMDSEKPSDEQSQENETMRNRVGATLQVDVDGLDAKAIADMIHLVFRFNKKAEDIKNGFKG